MSTSEHLRRKLSTFDDIVNTWVDAAFRLSDRDLKMMSRIVRAQMRRMEHGEACDVGVEAVAEERAAAAL